jgi:hypothetical protein
MVTARYRVVPLVWHAGGSTAGVRPEAFSRRRVATSTADDCAAHDDAEAGVG